MTTPSPRGQYEQEIRQAFLDRRARLGMVPKRIFAPIPPVMPKAVVKLKPKRKRLAAEPAALNRPHAARSREIIAQVLDRHGVSHKVFISSKRDRIVVAARREAAHRLREIPGLSYPRIAKLCGWKNHTTVLHALRRYEATLTPVDNFKPVGLLVRGIVEDLAE